MELIATFARNLLRQVVCACIERCDLIAGTAYGRGPDFLEHYHERR
ncbi:MAG TPA: hypothetical protein VNT33_09375 [Telluria sp.]|jgi:hypothetical protein|nr:hypothetical protein [Telluria sp.]